VSDEAAGILADYLGVDETDDISRAAAHVLDRNIVHGDRWR